MRMGLQNSPVPMAKPKHLSLMTSLAKRIAKDFSYLRIDFYEANDKIYFGELTFDPRRRAVPYLSRGNTA
nr:ATP-grasp fold amidoligase family protein [Candidatus Sodalis pierantonius]